MGMLDLDVKKMPPWNVGICEVLFILLLWRNREGLMPLFGGRSTIYGRETKRV